MSILPVKDRIVQHMVNEIIEPIFIKSFIHHTYGCIKNRGQIQGSKQVEKAVLKYKYCLKMDVTKFYPTINQDKLYSIIQRKIKDPDLLWLLHDIVFSFKKGTHTGVPIGSLLSQLFGNIYLSEFDNYVLHTLKVPFYLRYCDDSIICSNHKEELQTYKKLLKAFLETELKQKFSCAVIFNTKQGIDFLGYRHFKNYKILRKTTIKRMRHAIKEVLYYKNLPLEIKLSKINSYLGWCKHGNCYNLLAHDKIYHKIAVLTNIEFKKNKLLNKETIVMGEDAKLSLIYGKNIVINAYNVKYRTDSKPNTIKIQFYYPNDPIQRLYVVLSRSQRIIKELNAVYNKFPMPAIITDTRR